MEPFEIERHRRQERFSDLGNRIGDVVANELISVDITPEIARRGIDVAVARFAGVYPAGMIANIAQVEINLQIERRARAAAAPKPERKDRFGRPIREAS